MTRVITTANWTTRLAEIIEMSQDGDEIVVHNEPQKELALLATKRMKPDLKVTLTVCPPKGVWE